MKPRWPSHNDLRGATRLAADATAGLADLVEAMHERIARLPGVAPPALAGRTRGVTGLVYKSVRGITRLVGGSVDGLLGLLAPPLLTPGEAGMASPEREAIVAVLNGVLGDHLAATANPLATPMRFRRGGRPLVLERTALHEAIPDAGPRLLVLVHGLCMSDLQWRRQGHDHGAALARDAGWTPVYLHYNTGQTIAANGQALAQRLEDLLDAWPMPVERLAVVGHSMGGLIARSAFQHATGSAFGWPARLDDLVFLGTPHAGAPLERAGHGVEILLDATPYSAPLARLTRIRSAGITDLRQSSPVPFPLPAGPRCSTVAAVLGPGGGSLKGRMVGDGLVPLDSALGRHRDGAGSLEFDADRQLIVYDTGHLGLLSSAAVYEQLARWLK